MLLRRLLLPLLLALSVPLFSAPRPFAHEGSDLQPDPAVIYGRLPNGIRYAVRANAEPKGRAALRFVVLAGSFMESDAQRGLAHYLEHLSFDGSTHYPPGTLVEFFQRMGMDFGGDTNAYTSFDRTVYMIDLPDTKTATLEEGFRVFSDYAGGLLLAQKSVDKERGIILAEKRARDSVEFRTFLSQADFVYGETLIPKRLPIGTQETIEQADRARFLDLYNSWYRPERLCIVAVGDFDAKAVEGQIKAALSGITDRAPEKPEPALGGPANFKGLRVKFHPEPEAAATRVILSSVQPYAKEKDDRARQLRLLPRSIASAMVNRRLSILAKKEDAPFSAASLGIDEAFDILREAQLSVTCKPAQWRGAVGVAEQELRRALTHGFQESELKEAVARMRNSLEEAVKTASTRRSPDLAKDLVEGFSDDVVITSPEADLALLGPALDKLTPEACVAALREAWKSDGRFLFVTGNLSLEGDAEAALASAYQQSAQMAVTAPERISDETFAYTSFGTPGSVRSRSTVADLDLCLVEFSNGVRLNLKKTDFEAGVIHVSLRVGYGRLIEPRSLDGIASYAGRTFQMGGLGRHSIDDLQRLLAGKTVGFAFGVGDDALGFTGKTNRHDLLLQLQLITAYITDPGYRPEAARQASKGIEQVYNRLEHVPEGPLQVQVARQLAGGDTRFGVPPRAAIEARDLAQLRSWLAPQLASGAIEVAVAGDLDIESTIQAVAATLGALPSREDRPAFTAERKVALPNPPLQSEFGFDTRIPKGVLEIDWPTTDANDARLTRRLGMLSEVLNDRLRVKVREELGDAYSPQAGHRPSQVYDGYGFITARITLDPAQAAKLRTVVLAIGDDLATKGVTEDELLRAKSPTLTAVRESMRTNAYWLGSVLSRAQEKPVVLEWARTRLADVESINAAELSALAKTYLPSARASSFIVLPAAKQAAK